MSTVEKYGTNLSKHFLIIMLFFHYLVMEVSLGSLSVICLSHDVVIRRSVTGGKESSTEKTGWHTLSDG